MKVLNRLKKYMESNKETGQPEWLEQHLKYDPKENKESSLPNNESIIIPSIRIIEAYTPSTFSNLRDGVLKLGLEDSSLHSNRDLMFLIDKSRSGGTSWYNIGTIEDKFLPDQIKSISLKAFQPIPSLTIVVFNFEFIQEESSCLNTIINKEYETYTTELPRGAHRIHSPYHQKKKEVNRFREYLFSICTNWIDNYFSGLFSSEILNTKHPRMEIILLKENQPFSKVGIDREYHSYLYLLELGDNQEYYTSKDWENIFIQILNDSEHIKNGIVISGKLNECLSSETLENYGDHLSLIEKIIFHFRYFEKTFMIISLEIIAKYYYITANNLRDRYGNLEIKLDGLNTFTELEETIFTFQKDTLPICNELSQLDKNPWLFKFDVYELYSNRKYKSDKNLLEIIPDGINYYASSTINRIKQIVNLGDNLSRYFYSLTSNKSASANKKLSVIMVFLTIVIAFLTYILVAKELFIWPFN